MTCAPGTTLITTVYDIIEVRVYCVGVTNDPSPLVWDPCTGRVYDGAYANCVNYEVGVDFSHCTDPECRYIQCDGRECTIFQP